MLEGVFGIRKEDGFVEELRGLKLSEASVQILSAILGDGLEQVEWDVLADDGRALQQLLLLGREPIDARGEDGLYRGRHLDHLGRARKLIGSTRAGERVRLHQRAHSFFDEERIAPGLLREKSFDRRERGVPAQKSVEQLVRAVFRERIESDLVVITLASPGVAVLGPIVDEEEQPQGGQALHEAIQDRLCFRVDPVEVLEDDEERLDLSLAEKETFDCIERPLPTLGRIETLPCAITARDVEQREKRRKRRLQRPIQGHGLPEDLLSDIPVRILLSDAEVVLEELDDGEIAVRLAVGDRSGLENQPAVDTMGMRELEDDPGFAHARLTHDRGHLTSAVARPFDGSPELLHFAVPSDEAREPSSGRDLQTRADRARPLELEHRHRLTEAFHPHRPEGLPLNVPPAW